MIRLGAATLSATSVDLYHGQREYNHCIIMARRNVCIDYDPSRQCHSNDTQMLSSEPSLNDAMEDNNNVYTLGSGNDAAADITDIIEKDVRCDGMSLTSGLDQDSS